MGRTGSAVRLIVIFQIFFLRTSLHLTGVVTSGWTLEGVIWGGCLVLVEGWGISGRIFRSTE